MTTKETATRILQSWDNNAQVWTNAVRTRALESRRLVTDDAVLKAVLDTGGMHILDIGCGEGWLSQELTARERKVTGFDASADLISQARTSCHAQFMVLTYEDFANNPSVAGVGFDAAVCNFSLLDEHLAGLLNGIRQVVRPSGHLIIQTIHPVALSQDLAYADGWREETFQGLPGEWAPMPYYFRTIGSWIRELTTSGWRIVECIEPLHPSTGKPASLLFRAAAGPG